MKTKTDQIVDITNNSRDYLQAIYLDWRNNFLTLERFAEHYMLDSLEAAALIRLARRVHEERTQ